MKADDVEQQQQFNRTGIMTHPELSAELIQGTKQTVPSSDAETADIASSRAMYLEEGLPIGSRPAVIMEESDYSQEAGEGESIGTAEPTQENGLAVLLDKLGERLAFERQGTRLYEACLQKCELVGETEGGPSEENLRHIYEEELEHFKMLQKIITEMGGDATVQTPSADVAGVLSQGVLQVVSDPRTTMAQTLQAMLVAELADNDGWEMLGELASAIGHADLEEQCRNALEQEEEHLENVREWLSSITLNEANLIDDGVDDDDDAEEDEEEVSGKMERQEAQSKRRSSKRNTQRESQKSAGSRKGKSKSKK
jgi:rubrerythrin